MAARSCPLWVFHLGTVLFGFSGDAAVLVLTPGEAALAPFLRRAGRGGGAPKLLPVSLSTARCSDMFRGLRFDWNTCDRSRSYVGSTAQATRFMTGQVTMQNLFSQSILNMTRVFGLWTCTLAQIFSCFSKGPGAKVRSQPGHLTMPAASGGGPASTILEGS